MVCGQQLGWGILIFVHSQHRTLRLLHTEVLTIGSYARVYNYINGVVCVYFVFCGAISYWGPPITPMSVVHDREVLEENHINM